MKDAIKTLITFIPLIAAAPALAHPGHGEVELAHHGLADPLLLILGVGLVSLAVGFGWLYRLEKSRRR